MWRGAFFKSVRAGGFLGVRVSRLPSILSPVQLYLPPLLHQQPRYFNNTLNPRIQRTGIMASATQFYDFKPKDSESAIPGPEWRGAG
jgi:hypothetical protein